MNGPGGETVSWLFFTSVGFAPKLLLKVQTTQQIPGYWLSHTHRVVYTLRTWIKKVKSNFPSCPVRREVADHICGLDQHDFFQPVTDNHPHRIIFICNRISADPCILFSVITADIMSTSTNLLLLFPYCSQHYSGHSVVITFHSMQEISDSNTHDYMFLK